MIFLTKATSNVFAMEIKFVNVIGFRSEDPKYSAANLMQGGKWISEKKSRSSVNDITLSLSRAAVINAIDIGNSGSSFVSVDVSRVGLHKYESLLPSIEIMSARDARIQNNWTSVHMFCEDHFTPDVQEQKWDLMRITCMQPFLNNLQFGLSFVKVFCFPEKEPPLPRPITPPQPESAFAKMRERLVGKISPVVHANRSEQLLLAAKEKESSYVKKIRTIKSDYTSTTFHSGTNNLITTKKDSSQNSLEYVPTKARSPRYANPHLNSTEHNSCEPSKKKSFLSQGKQRKFVTSPTHLCSRSKNSFIDLSQEEMVNSQQCLEMCKKSSRSISKSSSGDKNHGEDFINLETESDSDASTVLLPLWSPYKQKGEHSSISTISPCRLQRDFDSLSEAETVTLDVPPEKIGKSMKPRETNPVEVLTGQDIRSICNEPGNSIALEDNELPGPSKVPCPLCSELFDVYIIEQHAATCNLSPEVTLICPMCSRYFPPEILAQHAELCMEITANDQ